MQEIQEKKAFICDMDDVNPDYVVLGETRTCNFEKLEKAIELVRGGAKLIGRIPTRLV